MKSPTCKYCEDNKKSEHFICVSCDTGMCEDCYMSDMEHENHCFDFHETLEDQPELYRYIVSKVKHEYGYMCYECIEDFSKLITKKGYICLCK